MKELFFIKDTLANKISYYHLLLLLASLPFDRFYNHIILISFAIHTFIHFDKNEVKPIFTLRTLMLQAVFFITVAGTIYTIDPVEAYKDWGKQITVLLIPLLFCINNLDLKKYRQPLLLGFSLACILTVIYLYADAFVTIRHYKLPPSTVFTAAFTNHNFSQPIGMHATFFSMQLALALVFFLAEAIKHRRSYQKLWCIFCICILSAGLVQLCSKSVFITLILTVNLVLPWFLLKSADRWKFGLVTASIFVLVIYGIFKTDTFKERYVADLKTDLSKGTATEITDPRLARWRVAMAVAAKAPVIGHGTGSETGLLQDAFFKNRLYNSYLNRLNAHSQYLSFLIQSGLIGLFIYLGVLWYGFRAVFWKKDILFFTFMALVTIVFLSENLLDVDKGIFFYAVFFSFFTFCNEDKKKTPMPVRPAKYFVEVATNELVSTS